MRKSPDLVFVRFFDFAIGVEEEKINVGVGEEPATAKTSQSHQGKILQIALLWLIRIISFHNWRAMLSTSAVRCAKAARPSPRESISRWMRADPRYNARAIRSLLWTLWSWNSIWRGRRRCDGILAKVYPKQTTASRPKRVLHSTRLPKGGGNRNYLCFALGFVIQGARLFNDAFDCFIFSEALICNLSFRRRFELGEREEEDSAGRGNESRSLREERASE